MSGAILIFMREIGIGIVGAGVRGVYCLAEAAVALTEETGLVVSGVYDLIQKRSAEAKKHLEELYAKRGSARRVRAYAGYDEMLDDGECEIILITNFTNQHRNYAIKALNAGKKVYLDKPISVTREDAEAIVASARDNPLIMGFTRRYEKSWIKAKELLESGVIGKLQMMEITSVIPYSRYLQTWHRRRRWSGGALNDKSSHHFDAFNWMAGEYPALITAVGGRSTVFPVEQNAPASCRVCRRVCPYRRDPKKVSDGAHVLELDSWKNATEELHQIDTCVYAPGSDIVDHALVSVVYPSGIKASLFFSIFGPDTKDQERLLLLGEKGKITVNRHSGEVTVHSDFGNKTEVIDCRGDEFETSHFGADRDLIRALRRFYEGVAPVASARDGYVSLDMVLAAQDSIQNSGQPVKCGIE